MVTLNASNVNEEFDHMDNIPLKKQQQTFGKHNIQRKWPPSLTNYMRNCLAKFSIHHLFKSQGFCWNRVRQISKIFM